MNKTTNKSISPLISILLYTHLETPKGLRKIMIDDVQNGKEFRPHTATIKATLVGSYINLAIFGSLALCVIFLFIFDQRPGAYLPVSIGLMLFSFLVAAAVSYPSLRRISYRKSLSKDIEADRYFVKVGPSETSVVVGEEQIELTYADFEFVGRDSIFLGNKRDWGSLVFARKIPIKLDRKQRASIVKPVHKGLISVGTYEEITAIPLVYFTKTQFEEIVTLAQAYHAAAR